LLGCCEVIFRASSKFADEPIPLASEPTYHGAVLRFEVAGIYLFFASDWSFGGRSPGCWDVDVGFFEFVNIE
jgi:hypothetical protein